MRKYKIEHALKRGAVNPVAVPKIAAPSGIRSARAGRNTRPPRNPSRDRTGCARDSCSVWRCVGRPLAQSRQSLRRSFGAPLRRALVERVFVVGDVAEPARLGTRYAGQTPTRLVAEPRTAAASSPRLLEQSAAVAGDHGTARATYARSRSAWRAWLEIIFEHDQTVAFPRLLGSTTSNCSRHSSISSPARRWNPASSIQRPAGRHERGLDDRRGALEEGFEALEAFLGATDHFV